MPRSLLLPAVACLLTLAACGGDLTTTPTAAGPGPSVSPSTTQTSPSPSPRPHRAHPSASASASALASPSAAAGVSAAPARAVPAAQGDVDGDGEPDEITYDGREAVVTLSGGGTARSSTAADIAGDEPPSTAGVEDLDRDGRAEVFVQVGRGASTGFLLVLRYDGRVLAPLTVDGQPRLLAFGGAATHGDGFSCTDAGTLVVRTAASEDGEAYTLESVTYAVRGSALVESGRTAGSAVGMQDPAVAAAYVVDCRSVGEGG